MLSPRHLVFVPVIAIALAVSPAHAKQSRESLLATGASAYQAGDFSLALKNLNLVLSENSSDPEALELLALTLKSQNRMPEALKIYQSLIKIAKLENWPVARSAAYVFESAVIEFAQGQFRKAGLDFQAARQAGFNVEAAQFFQGLCRYRENDFVGASKHWDVLAARASSPDISAAADYYLARLALDRRLFSEAVGRLRQAIAKASGQSSELAKQILQAAQNALSESNRTHFLAGVETLSEYDSNALLYSDNLKLTSDEVSTFRQTLTAALAVGRDRGNDGAWSLGVRSIMNYNTRKSTKGAEFAANELDVSWLPLGFAQSRAGLVGRGLALFRNQSGSGGEDFHSYLLSGSGGFGLESATGAWRFEAMAGNSRFLDDIDLDPELRRTGLTADGSLTWRNDNESGKLNPYARLEAVKQWTAGPEYRGTHARLTLGNKFYLAKWIFLAQGSAGLSSYSDRPVERRNDKTFAFDGIAARALTSELSVLARLGLAVNQSNLDELYSYRREVLGLGLRYLF